MELRPLPHKVTDLQAQFGLCLTRSGPKPFNSFQKFMEHSAREFDMSRSNQVRFNLDDGRLLLPDTCSIDVPCCETVGQRRAIAETLEEFLYVLARLGLDLRVLDGITVAHDCKATAAAMQSVPHGHIPLETSDQPGTMELARTVPVWRKQELRFHIVLRAGVGLMALSSESHLRIVAHACIAHEAAHVDHEGHLLRVFPEIYGRSLESGDRSQQTFLKAIDVWSEYAACRSCAMFRPEATEEFEGIFCRALEDGLSACKERITVYRSDQQAAAAFRDVQQIFGDVFICAGYFLGHLDGLELTLEHHAPQAFALLGQYSEVKALVIRLRRVLHELWLNEYEWQSIDVFGPVYDLICTMMALHGLAFARHENEWRIVMCEEEHSKDDIQSALAEWMKRSGSANS